MPRQPFLPTYSRVKGYEIGPRVLEHRPHLAAIVGQCISMWSDVELQMALCLGALMGVQSDAAVAVFLTLKNARAQREALSAAAGTTLPLDELKAFEAVLAAHTSVGKLRHDLAHGIYGISNELPDALLWCDMGRHANWLLSVYNAESKPSGRRADAHEQLKKDLFVYRRADLEETYNLIVQMQEAAFILHCHLRRNEKIHAQRLLQLCSLPLVAKELARIRAGKESD